MNEWTHFFIKIYLSPFILEKGWCWLCERDELETGTDCNIDPAILLSHLGWVAQLWVTEGPKPSVCHWLSILHLVSNWLFFKKKIPKFSAHRFWAWRHSHSSLFSIWGLLWQLWLSYPLHVSVDCTQCLCTWTKSRIVQSPTKLNDKI